MRVLVACKRGSLGPRDKWGHCLCQLCAEAKKANAKDRTEYRKQWQAANKDKTRAYTAKWLAANPESRKAAVQAWRAANPEKVAAMNAKAGAKWAASNKGTRMASVRARQLSKKMRTPPWAEMEAIADVYKEAARVTRETGVPHEVDHVLPLQGKLVSGLHVLANLQILERSMNRSKGNKPCAF